MSQYHGWYFKHLIFFNLQLIFFVINDYVWYIRNLEHEASSVVIVPRRNFYIDFSFMHFFYNKNTNLNSFFRINDLIFTYKILHIALLLWIYCKKNEIKETYFRNKLINVLWLIFNKATAIFLVSSRNILNYKFTVWTGGC